ncbi:hypothetical protein [Ramlibacter pallidus]|uniref:Uncharacterized protein n=1 Tax=Ramlibacter pallidus TaxID=2780087 RepID=A0ABR9S6H6_9BURK|nr:hypothetical protein [Ramlibacter pallidus]MBE7369044.1 hypothetical protein [Ramlibacter pallidus]
MPTEINRGREADNDPTRHEDAPIPSASDDEVLDETVRLAREGRKERDADPREPKSTKE